MNVDLGYGIAADDEQGVFGRLREPLFRFAEAQARHAPAGDPDRALLGKLRIPLGVIALALE